MEIFERTNELKRPLQICLILKHITKKKKYEKKITNIICKQKFISVGSRKSNF